MESTDAGGMVGGGDQDRGGGTRPMGSEAAADVRRGAWAWAPLLVSVAILAVAGMVLPRTTEAQWGRRGYGGGGHGGAAGTPPGGYYGMPGAGYGYHEAPAHSAPGYPRAGYGAPGPGYAPGGVGAPGYPRAGYGAPGPGSVPREYGAPGYLPPADPAYSYAVPVYEPPYAYPPAGQTTEQASTTEMQCQSWATAQTGYNPAAPSAGATTVTTGQAPGVEGLSVLRDGARGAAVGATGAATGAAVQGDDAGAAAASGAAAGAAMGGLMGGVKRRDQRSADTQQQNQALQQQSQLSAAYGRALEACLTGQGYTLR